MTLQQVLMQYGAQDQAIQDTETVQQFPQWIQAQQSKQVNGQRL